MLLVLTDRVSVQDTSRTATNMLIEVEKTTQLTGFIFPCISQTNSTVIMHVLQFQYVYLFSPPPHVLYPHTFEILVVAQKKR